MCHPHVFPSGEYLAGIQKGKKSKTNTTYSKLKKKECYNLHRKHEVLDSNNAIKTLEIFLFSTASLRVPVRM